MNQYEKDQQAWIKAVKLKNGDRVKVIVDVRTVSPPECKTTWPVGGDYVPVGTVLSVNDKQGKVPHDHLGITCSSPKDRSSVIGLPFFCLVKL